MSHASMLTIDRRAFEREFKRRDLSMAEVSRELGYHSGYLGNVLYTGRIRESVAVLLEKLYGIKRETIERKEEPEPVPVQQELVVRPNSIMTDQDWARLYRLMVEALKEVLG